MGVGHYLKRILETIFVHVFSRESMPRSRALKNCLHYWYFLALTRRVIFGAFVGFELFVFTKSVPEYSTVTQCIFGGIWLLF